MQCTPESNVYLKSHKGQDCYDDCSDSGYSGFFHSSQNICGADHTKSSSPVEFIEAKENLKLSVMSKERTRELVGFSDKDYRGTQRPLAVSWCETPKRDSSLRHRLLMHRSTTAAKNDTTILPCTTRTESPIDVGSAHWLSASCETLDAVTGALGSSTLKLEQELPVSTMKRRLLFASVRTSTLEDGEATSDQFSFFGTRDSLSDEYFRESISASDEINDETPSFSQFQHTRSKENSQSPISSVPNDLFDSSSVLCTPSSSHTPKYTRYVLFDTF